MTTKIDEKCCTCRHEKSRGSSISPCEVCYDHDEYEKEIVGLTDFTEYNINSIINGQELLLRMADMVTDETTRKTIIELAENTIIRCNAIQTRVEDFINDD